MIEYGMYSYLLRSGTQGHSIEFSQWNVFQTGLWKSFFQVKDIACFTSYLHRLGQMNRVQIDADESVCLCWHLAVLYPRSWFLCLLTSKRQHNLLYLYSMPCTGGMIIAKVCQLGIRINDVLTYGQRIRTDNPLDRTKQKFCHIRKQ